MADEAPSARVGKEGNRWFNQRPTGVEISEWFASAIDFPQGLTADHYIAGVTMIPGKEKANEPWGLNSEGAPMFREIENLVFTPYVKVETRVQFYHDLMRANADEWLGVIEPIAPPQVDPYLPPGFSRLRVASGKKDAKVGVMPFITCTMKVTVYKRSSVKVREFRNTENGRVETRLEGETVIDAPPATKIVPVLSHWGDPDVHALEKAETGAVGRALGMAGMLVVPGTGVATAEDMREVIAEEGQSNALRVEEESPAPEGSAAKDATAEPSHAELVALCTSTAQALRDADEGAYTAFLAWVNEKGLSGKVATMKDADIKVLLKKAERDLETIAKAAAAKVES